MVSFLSEKKSKHGGYTLIIACALEWGTCALQIKLFMNFITQSKQLSEYLTIIVNKINVQIGKDMQDPGCLNLTLNKYNWK